jgi:hypothetical protein
MSSHRRFATPAQSLYHHCSPYRELHVRRESFACAPCGTVHTPSQHRPIVSRELRTLQRCNVNDAPYTKGSAMLSGLRTKAGVADQTKRDLCLVQGPFPVASFKGHFLSPRSRAISCRLVQGPFPVASFKGHFLSPRSRAISCRPRAKPESTDSQLSLIGWAWCADHAKRRNQHRQVSGRGS